MESVIERNAMVNSINDSGSFKRVDADALPNLNRKTQDTANNEASNVNLSNVSEQIAMLKEIVMKNTQVINPARVKFLQELIASGEYQISSQNIAQIMFADMQTA